MKNGFAYSVVALLALCLSAQAQDIQHIVIFKEAGKPPRVEAAGVDLLGAKKVHTLLGEDFVVFHADEEGLDGVAPMFLVQPEIKPIIPETPSGRIPPVLPICQCPEDYAAALELRMQS